jgi:hypothetical protein
MLRGGPEDIGGGGTTNVLTGISTFMLYLDNLYLDYYALAIPVI